MPRIRKSKSDNRMFSDIPKNDNEEDAIKKKKVK